MRDEAAHQVSADGFGRVDDDGEIADAVGLLVLERLDQRHVAVQVDAVGVVDVVELVHVHLHLLGDDHELAEEFGVAVDLAVGDLEVGDQASGLLAPFLREGLEVHLDLLGDVLPLLLLALGVRIVLVVRLVLSVLALGALVGVVLGFGRVVRLGLDLLNLVLALLLVLGLLVVALRLHADVVGLQLGILVVLDDLLEVVLALLGGLARRVGRPGAVVVALEQVVPLGERAAPHAAVLLAVGRLHEALHDRVHLVGQQLAHEHPDAVDRLAARGVVLALEAPAAHVHDGALHQDVAGEAPRLGVAVVLVERMAEDAVHHEMQVVAHRLLERFVEPPDLARRIVEHAFGVGRQRIAGAHAHRLEIHAPQRQIEEAELHHELRAAFVDDVLAQGVLLQPALHLDVHLLMLNRHPRPPFRSARCEANPRFPVAPSL